MSWKNTDESSVTFQLSVSGPGEFGLSLCKKPFQQFPKEIQNVHFKKLIKVLISKVCKYYYMPQLTIENRLVMSNNLLNQHKHEQNGQTVFSKEIILKISIFQLICGTIVMILHVCHIYNSSWFPVCTKYK